MASGTAGRANVGFCPALYLTPMNVVCCQRRSELDSENYWFGPYKITTQHG